MLSTCIKLPFVIMVFVLAIFEGTFYTGFTVLLNDKKKFKLEVVGKRQHKLNDVCMLSYMGYG